PGLAGPVNMASNTHFGPRRLWEARDMHRELSLPLFWRVCLINGAVFALATGALVLSPATVSSQPLLSEIVVLSIGFAGIVVLNGLLLRKVLRPLDRLTEVMSTIDLRSPGRRLEETDSGPA